MDRPPQDQNPGPYQSRIRRVLDHIQAGLDRELGLEELGEVAQLSAFHFHRLFSVLVGESVMAHVRRLRLERAAYQLRYSEQKLIDLEEGECAQVLHVGAYSESQRSIDLLLELAEAEGKRPPISHLRQAFLRSMQHTVLLPLLTLSILVSTGFSQRAYRSAGTLGTETESLRSAGVALGDIDGDGDVDAVVANGRHWPQQNMVYINNGKAGFTVARALEDDLDTSYATPLADLDGDGDLDLVVGNDRAPKPVFLNDGKGRFQRTGTLGSGTAPTRSLTVADIDGDGDLDVLVTNRGKQNAIYLNDGRGTFKDRRPFGTDTDSTISVAVGDLDGDGDLDMALANRDGQPNFVALNDGETRFEERRPYGSGSDETRAVAIGDLNGDGHLDLVNGNIGQPNVVYLGDGTCQFDFPEPFGRDGGRTYALELADLDLDGDLDIVAGNVGQSNAIFFNRGSGKEWTEVRFGSEEHVTYGLAIGDLNGDDFPDIVTANSDGPNVVYLSVPAAK